MSCLLLCMKRVGHHNSLKQGFPTKWGCDDQPPVCPWPYLETNEKLSYIYVYIYIYTCIYIYKSVYTDMYDASPLLVFPINLGPRPLK